jgi:hypothetical protein
MHDLARSNDAVHSAFRTVHDDIGVSVANWKSPGKGYIVVSKTVVCFWLWLLLSHCVGGALFWAMALV